MNIFYVDHNPIIAAENLCDQHVVKMYLESVQILCTTWRYFGYNSETLYRKTHVNHGCCQWARNSSDNYRWLCEHARALGQEFKLRSKKNHKSDSVLDYIYGKMPAGLPEGKQTSPFLAMPDIYRTNDPVVSYRNYYINEKSKFARWDKGREKPIWYSF